MTVETPKIDSSPLLKFEYGITPVVQAAAVTDLQKIIAERGELSDTELRKVLAERTLLNAVIEYELAYNEYYTKRATYFAKMAPVLSGDNFFAQGFSEGNEVQYPSEYRLILARQTRLMATKMLMDFHSGEKDG